MTTTLKTSTGAALALGAVLATSACGQAEPSPGAPTSAVGSVAPVQTVTSGGVRLEATMAPAGGAHHGPTGSGMAVRPGLVVDYTVTNTGSTPLLAYDLVPHDLGSAALPRGVDQQHAWVYEQSGVLRLSKQGFATAPNVRFAAAPVMGGHVIAPGASVTGRAYAVSPPVLDVPGDSFQAPRGAVDRGLKQWQLCVQVDGRVAQARPASAGGGVVQAPVAAPQGDELVCTRPASIPVA
ncbi:hypothetical protein [Terrabacter aerolatus]|uniref:hypothetical protein n=1 Tax=Terrabacter aerolatus TaxID=422442 RepID=UPI0011BD73A9|nr:hypothetical protein [Terrabacter aerolatus]